MQNNYTKTKFSILKWAKKTVLILLPAVFFSAGNMSPHNYRPLQSELTEHQQMKAQISEEIFQNICRTIKDARKAPAFNFIYNYQGEPYYNAYYSPSNNTINFGEGIYDLARRFGKDSINVVATVMAHEIAHFYKDHGWAHAFGKANPDTEINKNVEQSMYDSDDRSRMEAEADYFGGIFGYMSGYNTLSVGGDFFDTLYTALEIPDKTFGYPSRQDRVNIYNNAKKQLEQLIPVYHAANMLNLVRRYEKAAICYDHVITTFPSREMFNNAGVALAQEALSLYTAEELKFVYPFGIDIETRLDNAGTKGTGETKEAKRLRLAKESLTLFNDAIRIDEQYAPAYINAALTSTLIGEHEMALGLAAKAVKYAEANNNKLLLGNAHIARGIAYANSDKKAEAKKEFNDAATGNPLLAEANQEVLTTNVFAKLFSKKKNTEEVEGAVETISEIGVEVLEVLYDSQENFPSVRIKKQNEKRPETIVINASEEDFDAIVVATLRGEWNNQEELEGFIMTKPNYKGATARGIKIGSTMADVEKKYGKPARMLGGSQTNFVFYEKTNIVFLVGVNQKVGGWMIYGKVK